MSSGSDGLEETIERSDDTIELNIDKISSTRFIDQIVAEITQLHENGSKINFNRFKNEICSILLDSPKASTLGKLFRLCNLSSVIMVTFSTEVYKLFFTVNFLAFGNKIITMCISYSSF